MERNDQVINNSIAESQFKWDIITKQTYYILIIHTILCCCQSKHELWLKILDNLLICLCNGMMTLINDYIIELILPKRI